MISEEEKNLDFVISVFKLRLCCLLGFMPEIRKCGNCKAQEELSYFSLRDNCLKCTSCGKVDKSAIQISDSTRTAIQYIVLADAKKIFSFNISDESLKELELVTKLYLNDKLEKEYKLEELF